jgi:hypothetical protein
MLRKTFFNFAPALGPGHSKRIIENIEGRFPNTSWEENRQAPESETDKPAGNTKSCGKRFSILLQR